MVSPSYVLFIHFTVSGGSKCQKTTSVRSTAAPPCTPWHAALDKMGGGGFMCLFLSNHKAKRAGTVGCREGKQVTGRASVGKDFSFPRSCLKLFEL